MKKNKFIVFPAIHLRNGKVARIIQGYIDNPVIFHTDPIVCAQQWVDQGAEWLQLVNLDAALDEDATYNWKLIEEIAELPVKIQFGGGIRNIDDVHWAFKSGIDRVVFGTGAVENPQLIAQAIAAYGGDAILLALDTDVLGEVKIHGWKAGGSIQAAALAIQMRQLGVTTAIHTSTDQDGLMSGADLDSVIDLAAMSGLRIIVGGGIGGLQDIRDCIQHDVIDGVIIGRALYTGKVNLAQALNLTTRIDSFETGLDNWKADQEKHWNKFNYELVEHNLKKHIPVNSPPLRILDAGGGNGYDSLGLARMNHDIDLADMSQQMLNDAAATAALAGVADRVSTHTVDLFGIENYFAADSFDIVLCHNVMQYIDEGKELLAKLSAVLKPGGLLSLVTTNQYSQPYQAAFVHKDLDLAYQQLDEKVGQDSVFGIAINEYRPEEVYAWLENSQLELVKYYGIRCMYNYWGSNELKEDEAVYKKLRDLEMELTERHPFNLTARQFQLILRKV